MRFFLLLLLLSNLVHSGFSQNRNFGISFGWGIGEQNWGKNTQTTAILGFGIHYDLGVKERIVLSPYFGYSIKAGSLQHDPLMPTIGDVLYEEALTDLRKAKKLGPNTSYTNNIIEEVESMLGINSTKSWLKKLLGNI